MGYRDFAENRPRMDFSEQYLEFLTAAAYVAADYTITTVGTLTAAVATGLTGGVLELTTSTTSGDSGYHDGKISGFQFVAGKKLEFEARIKLDSVLLPDWIFGLQITDTTPLAVSDGIWFQNDTGDALLDFHVAKSSVQTDLIGIATLVDNTYVKLGFYYDGSNPNIQVFLNDTRVASVPLTNAPSAQLCLSFGLKTNAAAARKMSVDYVHIRQER